MSTTTNLQARLDAVRRMGDFEPAVIERFANFIEQGPEEELFRTNPVRYAAKHGVSEARAIDLFLYATHAGLFDLSWGVICGGCGAFLTTPEGLKALSAEKTCGLCEVEIPGRLDQNVEVAFTVARGTRRIRFHEASRLDLRRDGFQLFQSTSIDLEPEVAAAFHESVLDARTLGARESWTIESDHDVPRLGLMAPEHHGVAHLAVKEGAPVEVELDLLDGRLVPAQLTVAPGRRRITIHNRSEKAEPVVFYRDVQPKEERPDCPTVAETPNFHVGAYLSGKRLLTSQTFRELFRADSVPGQSGLALKSLTLLFTDLKGSTEMYERIGDLKAYALVREHFDLLRSLVAERGGAVVKTIGDAIMASFAEPVPALDAAAAMNREIRKVGGGEDLLLKIGLHTGPCIAVESNERLDYFGQTVNIAARVQGIAEAREIVVTEPVYSTPGSDAVLKSAGLAAMRDQAMLKGVDGAVTVFRLR